LQSNFLQDYKEEGCGGVQASSILSNCVKLCTMGLLWNVFCEPKQPFQPHHQWCWICFGVCLSYHLFSLCQQKRKGTYAFTLW